MKIIQNLLFVFLLIIFSCNSGSKEYSEEESKTLEEAQLIHNEAIAIFSKSKALLDEVTEVKAELTQRAGIKMESGEIKSNKDSLSNNPQGQNDKQEYPQIESSKDKANTSRNTDPNDKTSTSEWDLQNSADSTKILEPKKALEQLNEAQAALMEWMRNIYQVPNTKPVYEDENENKDPAIGMDFDAKNFLTDVEFKKYPEGTSPNEILESQKKMKDEIMKAHKNLEQAIKDARRAYIYNN